MAVKAKITINTMAKLTTKRRNALKPSSFADPKNKKYPIPDIAHGRNADARVAQFGSPSEKKKVRAAVHKKFPEINQGA